MSAPALSTGASESQALAYLEAFWGSATYTNSSATPYNGMTAAQIYAYVAAHNPAASPYAVAVTASDLLLSAGVAKEIGTATNTAASAVEGTAQGVANASYLPSWLSGLGDFSGFLNALGNANTWIRVAKVIVGAALVIAGAAHLAGASQAVKSIASKIPVVPV